jgi:type IV pilus assembly protein PilY1
MKRTICITIIAVLCCGLPRLGHAAGPVMSTYCATPPFLVQSSPPNIMLVIDISGSMQFPAYIPDNWDAGGGHYSGTVAQVPLLSGSSYNYNGNNEYYGYFDTLTFYTYSSGKFVANGACTQDQWNDPTSWGTSKIPGNLLNWATMTRIDILRKVLIGGKSSSTYTASTQTLVSEGGTWTYTDTNLHCQFAVSGGSDQTHTVTITNSGGTCPVTRSSANVQLDIPQANRIGVIQEMADGDLDGTWDTGAPRFGLMVFNGDNVGLIVDGCDIQNTTASGFIGDLQGKMPYESTPTGEAMTNALDYFKHTRSSTQYGGSINNTYMTTAKDPWQASCQKSFILLISDGEWGGGYPNALDPVKPARQGRIGSFDGTTHDLRPGLTGSQVVTTYAVYAFEGLSGGRNSLRQVAIYGGFTDKDANDWPYPYTAYPTNSTTVEDANHLPTSSCDPAITWTENYCLEWDENQDGIPDNYYEAQEGQDMHDKLTAEIYDMMREASSGTSVSVLSTSAEGAGSLFQAYFDYKVVDGLRTVYWVGYLNALWIDQYGNIREDTDKDQALSLTNDYIIQFFVDTDPSSATYGQTMINRYQDVDGMGGTGAPLVQVDTVSISGITPIWEAGKKLALRDDTSDPRTIYTFIDADNDGVVDSGEFGSTTFVTSQATTLQPYLNADTSGTTTATNIIKFIRGQYVVGMRERRLPIVDSNGQTQADQFWKLGDITYSTPVAVGAPASNYHIIYGDTTYHQFYTKYKNRRVVIYAGANDGMLHAFNAGFYHEGDNSATTGKVENGWYSDPAGSNNLGRELWAYIPYNLLPQLRWLTATNYCHCYYVDLKPRIVDARIFADDGPNGTHPGGWGTILIGGMRLGGGNLSLTAKFSGSSNQTRVFRSAYFALDITNPEAPPKLLWEYWDKADSTNSNLGFTTSYPTVVRVGGDYTNVGNWYVIFGSGMGTLTGDGATTTHYVYILNLYTGALVRKVDMTSVDSAISGKKAFMADPITVDLAVDYQVDKGYIGASYYNSGWLGKMYRININEDTNTNNWTFSTFMSLDKPVMAAPSAAIDLYNRLWIYVGTGRYLNTTDQSDTSSQRLVGAWDPGSVTITFPSPSQLNDVTNIHVYQNGDVYSGSTYVSNFNTYLAARRNEYGAGTKNGWYVTMTGGERFLDKPTVIGGVVLFPTFAPTTDVCGYGGTSSLYAPYYETGTAYYANSADFKPVLGLGTQTITVGTKTYKELLNKTTLGSGMPTNAVIHTGKEQGVVSLIQLGTGVIKQLIVNPAFTPKNQTLFWEERR